ncbi:ABC transporter permease [Siculibacillus lacustris]|uniref:ABC transporter permease n=1 Tax=Siculibacillus lacustris TaxID=1549641 RepID=A0A4Q9VKY6_9HYPH|nr:ABC transporter permease [Siculibacillus lacustris]TBW36110.1 ABC transporter permease [Siculibacillus lacustris]
MAETPDPDAGFAAAILRRFAAIAESHLLYSFTRSWVVMIAAVFAVTIIAAALAAQWIAPTNPLDLASLDLMDSRLPPAWMEGGDPRFLIGTDDQGRDLLSALLYGAQMSIGISLAAVGVAILLGVTLGLISGYFGGLFDTLIMRAADVQLTFPAILTALLVNGAARALLGDQRLQGGEFWVLVVSIGLAFWVQYARTVRASTLQERHRDYVQAARLIGVPSWKILTGHVLPNVLGPVTVIATINLALAIITEATLSFLGVGLPPSHPSLGTLVRVGNDFLMSGEWWIVFFPGVVLAGLALAVNILGDWLREALNPKLR